MIKKFIPIFLLSLAGNVNAQNAQMADQMRADGKIYVVIAVLVLIFVSLAVYLALMDRRLTRIEKEVQQQSQPKPATDPVKQL